MKQAMPRVNMFLHLRMALLSMPLSLRLSWVRVVMGAAMMVLSSTPSSLNGSSVVKPAFSMPA